MKIRLLTVLLAFVSTYSALAQAAQDSLASSLVPIATNISPNLAKHGITVLTGSDPQFKDAMGAQLGAETVQSLAPIKPYTLLITNNSGQTITYMMVRYQRILRNGRTVSLDFPYWSEELYQEHGLRPGVSVLAIPSMSLMRTATGLQKERASGFSNSSRNLVHVFQSDELESIKGVLSPDAYKGGTVIVDSVVLSDGTMIGPDTWGFEESHRARLDVITEILSRLQDPSVTDADLQAYLSQKAANHNFVTGNGASSGGIDHRLRRCGLTAACLYASNYR